MFIIQHINPSYVIIAIHNNVPQLTNDDSLALEFETLPEVEAAVSSIGGYWIILEKNNQNID